MAITYEDFLATVDEKNVEFVNELHKKLLDAGCKTEVKSASQGYVVTYQYTINKKKISVINYVFRKSGMMVRVYARHVDLYQKILDTFPDEMKKNIMKANDCKRLNGVSECSPTCTAGYGFMMDEINYKKCKNSAFFWLVNETSKSFIQEMIQQELKYLGVNL